MKNFKKFTAFVLTLCMLFSLSVAVFAAEADEHTIYDSAPDEETAISTEAATSGTIQNSGIRWELDNKGWLTISGSGEAPVFQSADDQPWAAVRDQITEVWFEDVETLTISNLAYWFEGCVNLTTAELPLAPTIGKHAFYGCSKLNTITMYYGETVLKSIGEDAFWRETDSGDTLYIAYIIGYPESTVPFYTYDWAASNRSNRYFYDLYGVYSNADGAASTVADSGIMKAPAKAVSRASTGIVGTCPSCKQYSLQGTYVSTTHTSRGHAEYYECYKCHYTKNLGTYVYKDHGSGSYGSWTCPDCGSHTWVLDYEQDATCTRNGYREYSCDCGQSKRETIYATGHSYFYGSWEEYSSSQHRREAYCRNCGDSDYEYASHSMSYGSWSNSSSSQHSRTASCRTCGYSTTDYGNHSYSTGSWSKYSDTQHRRSKTCSGCGASTYDYANHSYSYGSWTRADDTQHKRTKTCSACGDSSEEYADHIDANGDGKCDDCGATVSLSIKWDAGTNGGTIDDKASITTTGKPNATATAPTSTPVKTGHAFKGWYTSASGGSLYNTVTITAAKTFYAQFTANSYTLTWDLGNGTTEETKQTYGEALVLPTEPTRKNAEFLGWFTEAVGGTQVDANTTYKTDGDSTYYAHWEITEVFSVTVPVVLPLTVDENGEVHVGAAEIINGSTGEVIVSSVSISTKNGWQLVPFDTDMAHEKVDARLLGFKINDSETTKTGDAETFSLTSPWTIAENGKLPLSYDAVVSAVSQPVTEQDVLSVVFVLEWKGE
ncbi:InlB B-repeat-containing protein [Ruthenibacterium lactatiformans]|uniref:InlB B-repeat-containing protein n=1 Tax=Ruthenibacterium lactatiformans TaxID=1550024 RepID=UPI0019689912|nr:InlB B-repeat-containing protein [Ruthenibacterium lactatiformans]MBN3015764.1 InlB B-repeat-containing protein [Ruthenibacterium lactatiformans]